MVVIQHLLNIWGENSMTNSPTSTSTTATTTASTGTPARRERDSLRHVLGPVIGLTLLLTLLVTAFALPAIKAAPRDLPIGVAGPAAATGQVSQLLQSKQPGAFAVSSFADEASLRAAIRGRDVYGGLAVSPTGPKLLFASAASPVVATALTGLAQGLGQAQGVQVPIEDVVPLPRNDPHGAALATALLPLLLGGIAPVAVMLRAVRRPLTRVLSVLATNLSMGFAVLAVLHYGLDALAGSYVLESLAMSLALGAISMTLLGLSAVASWPGLGLGVLTMLLLGMPLSGVQGAPELLPPFWARLGQALPPGAGGQLLRSDAYFDGRGATSTLVVLTCWAMAGLVLALLPTRRAQHV